MTQQAQTQAVADEATAQVLAALTAYLAGTLTLEAAASVVAAYVAAANNAAATIGDLSLAAAVTVATGTPAAPVGITRPTEDVDRLERAARTILTDLPPATGRASPEDRQAAQDRAQTRLQRLAESEVRKAVHDAHDAAVKASRVVTGWKRGLEPEACELCRWWWRDGRVWPRDHKFPTHQGCDCSQLIVTTTDPIQPTYVPSPRRRRNQ